MATNQTVLANPPDGAIFPDWIELYNGSQVTMDIGGYFLTDTPTNTTKFMFPAHTFMSPKAHLLVFCDPANTVAPGFHSGFRLKSSGEFVGLYAPDGFSQLDSITFGIQLPDLSIGRVPDGGTWTLNQPTPRIANEAKPLGPLANLFLNEWMATNSSGSDWLEIYNPSNAPVALAGVVLSSDLPPAVPLNRPIPALSFIDAAGFLQLKCVGNKAKSADELDFKLSHTSGETVTFYPAAGMNSGWLDQISFPGNVTSSGYWIPDESYGRLPDGAANIVAFAPGKTTPGASNFQPITNVVINEALT